MHQPASTTSPKVPVLGKDVVSQPSYARYLIETVYRTEVEKLAQPRRSFTNDLPARTTTKAPWTRMMFFMLDTSSLNSPLGSSKIYPMMGESSGPII